MDSEVEYRDPVTEHCAYVKTGDIREGPLLTEADLCEYLSKVVPEIEREIKLELPSYPGGCLFIVNMPSTKIENYIPKNGLGHAFVWFTNKEVFFKIVGLTYDGLEIINRPSSAQDEDEPPSSEGSDNLRDILKLDWSSPIRVNKQYVLPENDGKYVPSFVRAFAERPDDRVDGVLYCLTALPKWFTDSDLAKIFAFYITTGSITVTRTDKGNAFIEFSHTDDAYFALHMVRRFRARENLELAFDLSRFTPPLPPGDKTSSTVQTRKPKKKRGNQRY